MYELILIIISMMIVVALANYKNRNPIAWLLIIGVTNVFGLIALLLLPKRVNGPMGTVINLREFQEQRQKLLVTNITLLLAKLCKSDQVVTQSELNVVENFFKVNLNLQNEQLSDAKKLFNQGKNNTESFQTYAYELRKYLMNSRDLFSILNIMYKVASIDGVSKEEEALIDETASIFNIYGTSAYSTLKATYMREKKNLKDYYDILGLKINASIKEVKKAYHAKMSEFHPDKYESDKYSQEEKDFAYKKTLEIREAYDAIMDAANATA